MERDQDALDEFANHLSSDDYQCSFTTDPEDAIQLLSENSYSLFITSLYTGSIPCCDIIQKALRAQPDLSIIMLTQLTDVSTAIECMRLGAEDYIVKPFSKRDISQTVTRILGKRLSARKLKEAQTRQRDKIRAATQEFEHVTEELQKTKNYLENLLESTDDSIITIDKDSTILFANSGTAKVTGYPKEAIIGNTISSLLVGGRKEFDRILATIEEDGSLKS